MLIKELKDLESHGMLTRTIFAAVPLRVEYCLTDAGRSLGPMLSVMHTWGSAHMASLSEAVEPQCSGRYPMPLAEPNEAEKASSAVTS